MKAMIFAAGLGTRLQQLTKNCPKALVKVADKPLLERVLRKLSDAGFTDIVVNVHHFPDQIINYLQESPLAAELHLQISDEREELLETGGGLKRAFPLFYPNQGDTEPILIHNVDILSDVDLKALYEQAHNHDAVLLVSQRETARYLLFNQEMRMVGWTNIKTGEVRTPYASLDLSECHRLAFSGIHVVSARLQETMKAWPERFGIMDFYIQECANLDIQGIVQPNLHLLDVGKPDTIQAATGFIESVGKN